MSTTTETCQECGLPLAAHNVGVCPDEIPAGWTVKECADCGEYFAVSPEQVECFDGEGFDYCCDFCTAERLRAEEADAVSGASARSLVEQQREIAASDGWAGAA